METEILELVTIETKTIRLMFHRGWGMDGSRWRWIISFLKYFCIVKILTRPTYLSELLL